MPIRGVSALGFCGVERLIRLPVLNVPEPSRMDKSVTKDTHSSIGELVRQRQAGLSPAERKLAPVLLASYPIAGLESVARFAERARVSPPTLTRFISKLGFRGYPELQRALRQELHVRLSSPLARYHQEQGSRASGSAGGEALEFSGRNPQATIELVSAPDVDELVELLSDLRRQVLVLGGRPLGPLAPYLPRQLHLPRPRIRGVGT